MPTPRGPDAPGRGRGAAARPLPVRPRPPDPPGGSWGFLAPLPARQAPEGPSPCRRAQPVTAPQAAIARHDLRAEWVPIGSLRPWGRKPRINDTAAKRLAPAIAAHGWTTAILVQASSGRVIAGHTRLKAAGILGSSKSPSSAWTWTMPEPRRSPWPTTGWASWRSGTGTNSPHYSAAWTGTGWISTCWDGTPKISPPFLTMRRKLIRPTMRRKLIPAQHIARPALSMNLVHID